MNKRNLFVRITAIFLCALMILSVVTAALYAFAAETSAVALPDTGSESMTWVIIAVVAAVAVIIGCLVAPKMKKK
ncbi:MAG: LPXTG cell wall anchor domain-containing protein [Clostridia bacterium]|nr:LPXTG cell wall anchor domain-containing protein [Clostridia bacterium]